MGLLDRMTTLVRANINDLLDRAEDPEVMLNQILRDMEDQIRQAREQVAAMMAQEKELESDLADAQQQATDWNDRAELAVRHNQDALAREALARMNDATAHVTTYQQQLEGQRAFVTRLRTQLDALQSKYDNAMSNHDALIARHHRAQAQQQVTTAMHGDQHHRLHQRPGAHGAAHPRRRGPGQRQRRTGGRRYRRLRRAA